MDSQCLVVVKRSPMDKKDTFNYPCNTVLEFESKILKGSHHNMWVSETARKRNWSIQCKESGLGLPKNRKFKHVITVKEVTVEATSSKKKDAKNLAFKLMAVKLGEILRLLKPQPGRQTMLHVRPEKSYSLLQELCGLS